MMYIANKYNPGSLNVSFLFPLIDSASQYYEFHIHVCKKSAFGLKFYDLIHSRSTEKFVSIMKDKIYFLVVRKESDIALDQ